MDSSVLSGKGAEKKAPLLLRKKTLFDQYPSLKKTFENSSLKDLTETYFKIKKILMFLDIFCLGMNLIVVIWLFFNHFEYNKQAIEKYGALVGSIYGIKRILKCNPFSKGGYDPLK